MLAPPPWGSTRSEGEARSYLQERLTLFTKLMFTSFVILMAFLAGMYQAYPSKAPLHNDLIFGGAVVLLGAMAVIWRGALARKELAIAQLNTLDVIYALFIGLAFAASAVLADPLRPAAYASLVYGVCTVFTRALVVPSTGRRTFATSVILFSPMFGAAIYLGAATDQELPGPAYAAAAILLGTVAIVLATMGSRIIYGLRRTIRETLQLGQYTLVRMIGKGGMGEVYEARHSLLRRRTAIKLMKPALVGAENLDRFEREVQHMSQLTHANTVAVFDYGRSFDGLLYYAMEYLDGINLEDLVRVHGPQPADRVAGIMIQVAGALQEAHDANLIHRDVKPANIILCERGGVPDVAKVVDFGLVKEITRDAGQSTQVILGTAHYIAPETVTDPDSIGPGVDLYALGAVGYFLLTGKRLFEGKTAVAICSDHASKPPPPLVAPVPDALAAIVMRLLAKKPEQRFDSAATLAEALEALPRQGDWDRRTARGWWRDHAARPMPSTETPTVTLAIDLAQRT
jgi:tRNA A-37 threonylcarbamoyl transferase component Bud32